MSFLGMLRVYRQDVVDGYVGGMQWYPHPHIHYLHALPHVLGVESEQRVSRAESKWLG
jgi:hypothetical protein